MLEGCAFLFPDVVEGELRGVAGDRHSEPREPGGVSCVLRAVPFSAGQFSAFAFGASRSESRISQQEIPVIRSLPHVSVAVGQAQYLRGKANQGGALKRKFTLFKKDELSVHFMMSENEENKLQGKILFKIAFRVHIKDLLGFFFSCSSRSMLFGTSVRCAAQCSVICPTKCSPVIPGAHLAPHTVTRVSLAVSPMLCLTSL